MFGNRFSHYLTYGATDQKTVRELSSTFDGLIVPGTVGAFQRDGTGGFVLTLSATAASPAYVIDPRFPLFQQKTEGLTKKSHAMLADIFGISDLLSKRKIDESDFDDVVLEKICRGWIDFNLNYTQLANSKFSKYEKRLREKISEVDSKAPAYVIPPYFVSAAGEDWWELSKKMFDRCVHLTDGTSSCVRVVACDKARHLLPLLEDIPDARVAIWVSDLNEMTSTPDELSNYGLAIRFASSGNRLLFAMYGGFFSVVLSTVGLAGACHGIGFGEHRSWRELPQSGPPPARYYFKQVHRYISQEEAQFLWRESKIFCNCTCPECVDKSPIELSYHELMKHSVYCRSQEIAEWTGLSLRNARNKLDLERSEFERFINTSSFDETEKSRFLTRARNLDLWIETIDRIESHST